MADERKEPVNEVPPVEEKKERSEEEIMAEFLKLMSADDEEKGVRNSKASVFTDVFQQPEYTLKLFKALHPEETDVTEKDIRIITLKSIMVISVVNDLGFMVGNRFVMLFEAQSTWSLNILLRILFYLAKTYSNYVKAHGFDLYGSKVIPLPEPEFYVIYTGPGKKPTEIKFSDTFFPGQNIDLEIKAKVITASTDGDVIDQYIKFTAERDRNVEKYGQTRKAAYETVKHCISNDILKDYFEKKGMEEVVSLMMLLFDEETIMRNHDASLRREVKRETEQRSLVKYAKKYHQSFEDTIDDYMQEFNVDRDLADKEVREYWQE